MEVYAAAVAATHAPTKTSLNISPTKEEVKEENRLLRKRSSTYEQKIGSLELSNTLCKRKVMSLKSCVHSLSDSLKSEKRKSRAAVEQLLVVRLMQHNKLLETLEIKITNIKTKHGLSLCQLHQDNTKNERFNQNAIKRLTKQHSKQMTKLSSEYTDDLIRIENGHNKSMVSLFN
jgi:hypothetical protein